MTRFITRLAFQGERGIRTNVGRDVWVLFFEPSLHIILQFLGLCSSQGDQLMLFSTSLHQFFKLFTNLKALYGKSDNLPQKLNSGRQEGGNVQLLMFVLISYYPTFI